VEGIQALEGDQTERGKWVHEVLSGIEYIESDPSTQIRRIAERIQSDFPTVVDSEAIDEIAGMLELKTVKPWLLRKKDREVWREKELVGSDGRLNRIDRLVRDGNRLAVIDFKTGSRENEAPYIRQVRRYMEAVRGLYADAEVAGLLLYVDTGEATEVMP
jgi:ATP-dependent exoDNAse (exonuclease V) beta subunit